MAFTYSATKKKNFIELTADTNCSFIEAVDELFQQSSADELMEIMSTPLLSAYCLFCFEKKKDFQCFCCRCIWQLPWSSWRAVPAPLVEKCIEHDVIASATCVDCLFFIKNRHFLGCNCRSLQKLQWSSWQAVPVILGCKSMESAVNAIAICVYCLFC